jgi:hypothetical protein
MLGFGSPFEYERQENILKGIDKMKKIILGVLFLSFFVTVGYCQEKASATLTNYKALAEQCKKASSVGCCMASVRAMEKGKYMLDTGKSFKNTTCPVGYQPTMMRCIDSYRWCVPVRPIPQNNE